jgi:hypothetical protein
MGDQVPPLQREERVREWEEGATVVVLSAMVVRGVGVVRNPNKDDS